jgi:SNF2 family DNA or RNA helicase
MSSPTQRVLASLSPVGIVVTVPPDKKYFEQLKEIGARKVPTGKWVLPSYYQYYYALKELFPQIEVDALLEMWIKEPFQSSDWAFDGKSILHYLQTHPRHHRIWEQFYEFQRLATKFLVSNSKKGSLLALRPGRGKTAVAILASEILGCERVLVVSPLILLPTWEREYQKWSRDPKTTIILHGLAPLPNSPCWVITNYDTLTNHPQAFMLQWDLIIIDESILVKNRDTLRARWLGKIIPRCSRVWELSGSPTSRYIDDLWSQFHLLDPQAFKSYWRFTQRYCVVEKTIWGDSVIGSKDLDFPYEFRDLLFTTPDELDIPEPFYQTIYVDLPMEGQGAYYRDLQEDFITVLSSGEELSVSNKVSQMTRLLQVASSTVNIDIGFAQSIKVNTILELLELGELWAPILIWTHWKAGADNLYERLAPLYNVGIITGDTSTDMRDTILESYLDGKIQILILSLPVGKFGLTLTNTQTMIYMDKTFSMDDFYQSLQRVLRIGLDHQPTIISLIARNTIDEIVADNLAGKSVDISKLTNSDLVGLLKSLGKM